MQEILIFVFCVFVVNPSQDSLQNGVRLMEEGHAREARLVFQGLAESGETAAYYYLARMGFAQEHWQEAISFFERAVNGGKPNSKYHHWLGKAYLAKLKRSGMVQKATLARKVLEHYQRAPALDGGNIDARESLAYFRYHAHPLVGGSKGKAKRQASEIMELDPLRGGLILAKFFRDEKENQKALETYRAILAENPDTVAALFEMGQTLQAMERVDPATEAFENVLRLDPNHLAGLYCVGRNSATSGKNLARGATCLKRYLDMKPRRGLPSKAAAHWRLGMIYQCQGSLERARESFEKALDLEPGQESLQEALAQLEHSP